MKLTKGNIRYTLYVGLTVAAGGYVLWRARLPLHNVWLEFGVLLLLTFTSEAAPVAVPRLGGTISVATAFVLAALITYGGPVGVWLAALGTVRVRELKGEVPLDAVLFNRGQLAITAFLTWHVYDLLGGVAGEPMRAANIAALVVASLSYPLINFALFSLVVHLYKGISLVQIWSSSLTLLVGQMIALSSLAILISVTIANVGLAGVILFVIPFLVARYSFQQFVQLRELYLSTIVALTQAIEARDPYTSGHSEAVKDYALAAAKALKMPAEHVERLEYVSLLHDIGKVAVPDSILKSRGRLTPAEYGLVQQHPAVGAAIIHDIKLLGKEVDAVRYHHEHFDGTGYPEGKAGADIPLAARILAVADAFDAMTSDRPYRLAMTYDQAVEELRRCSGTQFDPVVVEAFLSAVKHVRPRSAKAVAFPAMLGTERRPEQPTPLEQPSEAPAEKRDEGRAGGEKAGGAKASDSDSTSGPPLGW